MSTVDITAAILDVGFAVDGSPLRGGTASVHPGRSLSDDRRVAVKVLDPSVDAERFKREASILSTIDHHAVAPLIDFGQLSTGHNYLATTWADGETLADRLDRTGPLDVATVRRVLVELCDALEHVHRLGVVHRDLSLANVLIDRDNRLTLIDFGIARAADQPTMTATTDLVGTTRYLAPELLEGAPPSPASDQYAAAVIAYELAAGIWPFDEASTVGRTLHHHLSSNPIPLTDRVLNVPEAMSDAIGRSLSKRPEDRFDSVQGLADASLAATVITPPQRSRRPKGRAGLAIVGAAFIAITAGVFGIWLRESNGEAAILDTAQPGTPEPTNGENGVPVTTWPAGLAAQLECNVVPTPGFESNSLPDNFWGDPNDRERERLLAGAGVDASDAIAIGRDGQFGAFGTIIDIRRDTEYVFAASVWFTDRPFVAEASVSWLDSNFQLLDDDPVSSDLLTAAPGRVSLIVPSAPAEAAFAVTRLYKDESAGVLIADELVFTERDSACAELLGLSE